MCTHSATKSGSGRAVLKEFVLQDASQPWVQGVWLEGLGLPGAIPKGPCAQIVYTLGPMYPYREYFKANVYTI